MALPAPWLSYKTQDGKEYYYNPETKVTTWTRPSRGSSSSSKTPPKREHHKTNSSPALGAERGGLLAQIQQGTNLKKVKTVEKTLFAGHPSGGSGKGTGAGAGAGVGTGAGVGASAPAASGGGGMGSMMAAIKSGGNLRKAPSSSMQKENISGGASASNGAGGFAEIMRKNREAAARRSGGGSAPLTQNGSSAPSTPRQMPSAPSSGGYENGNNSVEIRLAAIESKLDKIMAHLGIN
ncbi:unnamed protein product [Peronospora farinosa]|uniref:WW domain-containing protein n=1 Tax=Peronospora farinosa TaxID=134698 RepID=A0AAV0UC42_9STRA|nr:unnamed protein product [Peronospora farinosa]CAI5733425.1 unnamed protein product [Peronospora farinosa]